MLPINFKISVLIFLDFDLVSCIIPEQYKDLLITYRPQEELL